MSQKNNKTKELMDLDAQITTLAERLAALECISLKLTRKKRQYTVEQRASIRERLLVGQETARKRREAEVNDILENRLIRAATKYYKSETCIEI